MGKQQRTITITLSDDKTQRDVVGLDTDGKASTEITMAFRGILALSEFIATTARKLGKKEASEMLEIAKFAFFVIQKDMTEIITSDDTISDFMINKNDAEEIKRQIAEMRGNQ